MKKPVITLYLNDPMGKRWMMITEAARRAEKELNAELLIIKKTSPEYAALKDQPPCPSVAVDGGFIARNDIVTFDQLRAALAGGKNE